jgi:DNA gyrase/topoisomerase IV subunit B
MNKHKDLEKLDWREAVRKRPAMYTGSTGVCGFISILKGFFANFYAWYDPSIVIEAKNLSFEITGSQSGIITLDKLETKIPANANETLHPFGFNFAVLNALSQNYEFTLFDKDENEILNQVYQQGLVQSGTVDDKEYAAESLQIKFELDDSTWEDFEINPIAVTELIKTLAFLNKDKTFELKYFVDNQPCRIIYHFKHGLKEMLDVRKLIDWDQTVFDTHIEKDFESFSVELAFAFQRYGSKDSYLKSFVNDHHTVNNGTHTFALISAIIEAAKKYVEKHLPKKKFVITKQTVLSFLLCAIHIKMKQPSFAGATMNQLQNREIIKPLSDYIADLLFEKLESNKEEAESIISHFAEIHRNNKC